MIDIKKLKKEDKGKMVLYSDAFGKGDKGKIKSWNDKFIFVVYKAVDWNLYEHYTGVATRPEDLTFMYE